MAQQRCMAWRMHACMAATAQGAAAQRRVVHSIHLHQQQRSVAASAAPAEAKPQKTPKPPKPPKPPATLSQQLRGRGTDELDKAFGRSQLMHSLPALLATRQQTPQTSDMIPLLEYARVYELQPALIPPFELQKDTPQPLLVLRTNGRSTGIAVASDSNWLVLVPSVIEGELVIARPYRHFDGYSLAELVRVVVKSPRRIEPACKFYDRCSACSLQHLSYQDQLGIKQKILLDQLRLIESKLRFRDGAGLETVTANIVQPPKQFGYRSKISPRYNNFMPDESIGPIGFTSRGRVAEVTDVESCAIATDEVNSEYKQLRASLKKVVNEGTKSAKGKTLIVHQTDTIPESVSIAKVMDSLIASRSQSDPMPSTTDLKSLGIRSTAITGSSTIVRTITGSHSFRYLSGGTFPANASILPLIFNHILDQIRQYSSTDTREMTLVDCNSTVGLYGISLASMFRRVVGIERDNASVLWAQRNAMENRVLNCEFHSDANIANAFNHAVSPFLHNPLTTAAILHLPNLGLPDQLLDKVRQFGPQIIVIVGAQPQAAAKNLAYLISGKQASETSPVDPSHSATTVGRTFNIGKETFIMTSNGDIRKLGGDSTSQTNLRRSRQASYSIASITPFDSAPQTVNFDTILVLVRDT